MKLLPTKNQWTNWSDLEKLGAVSAYTTLIGFVLSIVFFFYPMLITEKPKENKYIQQGVDQALKIYKDWGMAGIQADVEYCYQEVNKESDVDDVLICLSADTTGVLIDLGMTELIDEFPASHFSNEGVLIKRAAEAFRKTEVAEFFWKNFLHKVWLPEIASQYYETMDERN